MKVKLINILVELILIIFLLFNVLNLNIIGNLIIIVSLLLLCVLNRKRIKLALTKKHKKTILFTILITVLFMVSFYCIGIKTEFQTNYSAFYKGFLKPYYVLLVFITVFIEEVLRYLFSSESEDNNFKKRIPEYLLFIIYILIDVTISSKSHSFDTINQVFELFAIVVTGSIFKNILLNYMIKNTSIISCLVYRLIMDLYIFIIPFIPSVDMFIEAIVFILFPYIYYLILISIYEDKEIKRVIKDKRLIVRISNFIWGLLLVILICLISKQFTYSLIAVGSGSMSGTIEKGDGIVYKRYDPNNDELHKGDIIIYDHNGVSIIHRIEDIDKDEMTLTLVTKGDANKDADSWTVFPQDVKGVVKFKIKWIGIPSVYLSELF